MQGGTKTLAQRLRPFSCPFIGPLKELTPEQLKALHVFKDEVCDALEKLYEALPPEQADPILAEALQRILDDYRQNKG